MGKRNIYLCLVCHRNSLFPCRHGSMTRKVALYLSTPFAICASLHLLFSPPFLRVCTSSLSTCFLCCCLLFVSGILCSPLFPDLGAPHFTFSLSDCPSYYAHLKPSRSVKTPDSVKLNLPLLSSPVHEMNTCIRMFVQTIFVTCRVAVSSTPDY